MAFALALAFAFALEELILALALAFDLSLYKHRTLLKQKCPPGARWSLSIM